MRIAAVQYLVQDVPAGATLNMPYVCEFVHCIETTGPFTLIPQDSGGGIYYDSNTKTRFASEISQFDVRNDGAAAIRIKLVLGFGDYDFGGVSIAGDITLAAENGFNAVPDAAINAATTAQIKAADANRRALYVTNPSTNTAAFRVGGVSTAADKGTYLDVGSTIIVPGTAAVYAYNTGAAAQTLTMSEVTA